MPYAIESCLSQSFQDIEIIIGDDGSDDGSIELIEQYCRDYPEKIRYFVMERPAELKNFVPSIRASNVIKTALKKANGRYAVILSGDDYFCDSKKFADAAAFLNSHETYSAYADSFKMVYEDGQEMIYLAPRPRNYPASFFWSKDYIHLSSFVWRKSVFDEGWFLERFCDDTGLIFSIACAGKVKFSEKVSFAYRQHNYGIMATTGKMGLNILELMLFQDCLRTGKMIWSSCSRFAYPLLSVYRNRAELHEAAYTKYIKSCEGYSHNVVGEIINSDASLKSRLFIYSLMLKCMISRKFFGLMSKLIKLPGKVQRKLFKL